MKKDEAIAFFGSSVSTAAAVGVTHQAISRWPSLLPRRIADRVIAAAVRAGRDIPKHWIPPSGASPASPAIAGRDAVAGVEARG